MAISPNILVPALLIIYIAWRVYARIRRHIGKQLLQPRRLVVRIVIYSVIVVLIAGTSAFRDPSLLGGIGGGLVLGAALAFVGLKLTVFETTREGQYYTPNTVIGIGLSALFIARVVYRVGVLYNATALRGARPPNFAQSGLTLLFFGLLIGYYIAYYAGVLARCSKQRLTSSQSAGAMSKV